MALTAKFVINPLTIDKQFARQALRPLTPATATMAAAKITPNFPGAYSGQVDTWEEEIRDQIKLLPAYGRYRPRLARRGSLQLLIEELLITGAPL